MSVGRLCQNLIQSNREAVAKDMSRGSGDTLNSLAEIGGCSNPDALSNTYKPTLISSLPT